MYSSFQLAQKYLYYYLRASNGKGHGIHSPFVFDFITHILNGRIQYDYYQTIETLRRELLHNRELVGIEDLGAGSSVFAANKRTVKQIAQSSLKNKKFARLLFRIVSYYKPETIIELGTSLGITTAYLASANPSAKIFTLEGSKHIAKIAENNFQELGYKNIQLIHGNFDDTLPELLKEINSVELAFIDGNHRKDPTLNYFNQLVNHAAPSTVLIFDDIHWSKEMEEAWIEIQQHSSVTLSIDLFFIGIIFFKKDFKVKQHFVIRF